MRAGRQRRQRVSTWDVKGHMIILLRHASSRDNNVPVVSTVNHASICEFKDFK
jgi:hypothetical protein